MKPRPLPQSTVVYALTCLDSSLPISSDPEPYILSVDPRPPPPGPFRPVPSPVPVSTQTGDRTRRFHSSSWTPQSGTGWVPLELGYLFVGCVGEDTFFGTLATPPVSPPLRSSPVPPTNLSGEPDPVNRLYKPCPTPRVDTKPRPSTPGPTHPTRTDEGPLSFHS